MTIYRINRVKDGYRLSSGGRHDRCDLHEVKPTLSEALDEAVRRSTTNIGENGTVRMPFTVIFDGD